MTKKKPKRVILTVTIEENDQSVTSKLEFEGIKGSELAPACTLVGAYLQHVVNLLTDGNKAEMKRLEKYIESIEESK